MLAKRERAKINSINAAKARGALGGEFWTGERVAKLRQLWPSGLMAIEIAGQLGRSCTKSMVIGKARRLGLGPCGADDARIAEKISAGLKGAWRNPRKRRSMLDGMRRSVRARGTQWHESWREKCREVAKRRVRLGNGQFAPNAKTLANDNPIRVPRETLVDA